jgi:hypothetical protein
VAKITIDTKKVQPAHSGARRDYIKPGTYQFKVVDYSDKNSAAGKVMHAFTSEVISKGEMAGKKITDRFAMPKSSKESQFPVERLLAFLYACGAKKGGVINAEGSKLVGRSFVAEVYDQQEEARTDDSGRTYPARTVSALAYPDPSKVEDDDDDEDDDDEAEEDEDEDEEEDDEEDEDEDEDEDDEDDNDDEDEDEDEEEEEPEPVAKKRGRPAKAAVATRAKAPVKTKAKASAKAPAKATRKASATDFPFDD